MGVALSFSVAILESLKDSLGKVATREMNVETLLLLYKAVAFMFVLPFAMAKFEVKSLSTFLLILSLNASLNALAFYLYLKAISSSPLSLSVPMLSFSPVLLLLTSRIILNQKVPALGALGVISVAFGSYLLNAGDIKKGFLAPLFSLLKERGSLYMLAVALIWSVTANLDRLGVDLSTPFVWVVCMNASVASVVLLFNLKEMKKVSVRMFKFPLAMGIADGVGAVAQMYAITLIDVPYVIAFKRTSVLISTLLGLLLFKEKRWRERVSGAVLMTGGAILIILRIGT